MTGLKTVGLIGNSETEVSLNLLSALAASCGLGLRRARWEDAENLAGFIILDSNAHSQPLDKSPDRPSIRIRFSEAAASLSSIQFGAGSGSPFPFRGCSVHAQGVLPNGRQLVSGEIIATCNGQPVWITSSESGVRKDTCWVSRPWIQKGDCAFHHLNGDRFMNFLPLVEWFRSVSDWNEWQHPPQRACFLFDDPNLHAPSYGFVKFAELAAEGRHHHYHIAFATVPMDAYYVNSTAAQIFREHPETLSFLFHGNNHTYRELAGRQSTDLQVAQMRQAVSRIGALEIRTGLSVSRVMAPPHGVCSAEMMGAMTEAGFEAVCVSHGSVWTGNPDVDWTVSLGAVPVAVVSGLPVIPRFGLDHKPENKVLLAAYLRQPIIPVGHHWDLADGTEVLSEGAECINNLGNVAWNNLTDITKTNYRYQVRGQTMRIQTLARRIDVPVPEGISELVVEAPWLQPAREHLVCVNSSQDDSTPTSVALPDRQTFAVTPGSKVEIAAVRLNKNGQQNNKPPKTPLNIVARKMVVELRDRCMPHLPRAWFK
jgi:hypothetical protein